MGNALEIVKKKANYVTTSNNEDGVAIVINKFILNK
ncbi:HAD hydrolase family protein [Clostridium psychrophilum]|nr:HAD hydrolase family protein [Clostridium psychrophilum]